MIIFGQRDHLRWKAPAPPRYPLFMPAWWPAAAWQLRR